MLQVAEPNTFKVNRKEKIEKSMDMNGEIPCLLGKICAPTCRGTSAQAGQLSGQECEGTNTSHEEREGVRAGI